MSIFNLCGLSLNFFDSTKDQESQVMEKNRPRIENEFKPSTEVIKEQVKEKKAPSAPLTKTNDKKDNDVDPQLLLPLVGDTNMIYSPSSFTPM